MEVKVPESIETIPKLFYKEIIAVIYYLTDEAEGFTEKKLMLMTTVWLIFKEKKAFKKKKKRKKKKKYKIHLTHSFLRNIFFMVCVLCADCILALGLDFSYLIYFIVFEDTLWKLNTWYNLWWEDFLQKIT